MIRFTRLADVTLPWRRSFHPASQAHRVLLFVALLATVLSSYPVIFLGKSYVSPNYGTPLLYGTLPALPGSTASKPHAVMGSDVGAIMWQQVPYSMVQHRALFRDGELPLWNRYNSGGVPLLGQGQSMLGDPLHWLVIAAKGAAWAWDAKYVIARLLFSAGLGLLVHRVTRHVGASAIVALAAPFAGFFVYRVNHPAFFSLCYSPWPLYCWVRIAQAETLRSVVGWQAGMLVANLALMTSGTLKEAYMLLVFMNLAGACVLLFQAADWRVRMAKLAIAAWAGLLFAAITMPVWRTFLDTLREARTTYDTPGANQLSPALLLGSFDEALFRALSRNSGVFNPSANFLLLAGCLYGVATWREQRRNRFVWAIVAAGLVPFALVYGVIPGGWITRVPFVANIIHIDNTFTCVLIVLWSVLAGIGFATAARRLATGEGRKDLTIAGAGLGLLIVVFVIGMRRWETAHTDVPPARLILEPFGWGYLAALVGALVVLGLIARRSLRRGRVTRTEAAGLCVCAFILLWRQGLHAEVGFSHYAVRGAPRADFQAVSPTVSWLQSQLAERPGRVVGNGYTMMGGWSGVYGIEGVSGPDALMNVRYRELEAASGLSREWDWRYHLERGDLPGARRLLDFLNVRFYVAQPDIKDEAMSGAALRRTEDLKVFESETAWPRAFFTDRVLTYSTLPELTHLITEGDGRPAALVQTCDREAMSLTETLRGRGLDRTIVPAEAYRFTEDSTAFEIHAPHRGIVVLAETLWPGEAHAEIDGQPVPTLRVNHAFQGWMVSAGTHRAVVRYRPAQFDRYLAYSLTAFGVLALTAIPAWIGGGRVRWREAASDLSPSTGAA